MKTNVPLKRIVQLRPADLLLLLGAGNAEVVGVETLELPASTTSIDTVLRLRQNDGQEYLASGQAKLDLLEPRLRAS
jgi:hypothetical protein